MSRPEFNTRSAANHFDAFSHLEQALYGLPLSCKKDMPMMHKVVSELVGKPFKVPIDITVKSLVTQIDLSGVDNGSGVKTLVLGSNDTPDTTRYFLTRDIKGTCLDLQTGKKQQINIVIEDTIREFSVMELSKHNEKKYLVRDGKTTPQLLTEANKYLSEHVFNMGSLMLGNNYVVKM